MSFAARKVQTRVGMRPRLLLYVAASLVASAALAQPPVQPPGGAPAGAPASSTKDAATRDRGQNGQAEAVLQRACTSCHGIDVTVGQPRSRDEWTDVVSRMIGNGAQLSDDEYALLIDYLAAQHGPSSPNGPAK